MTMPMTDTNQATVRNHGNAEQVDHGMGEPGPEEDQRAHRGRGIGLAGSGGDQDQRANSTMFSIMLRCARLARPAKPVSTGRSSRLPASVVNPTVWLAAAAAIRAPGRR